MALKLNLNQPVQLMLSRPDPKRYQNSNRPDSYMYSVILEDGTEDKVFLSADCSQTLQELQIAARQPFVLCRRKTPAGVEYFEVQTSANSTTSPETSGLCPSSEASGDRNFLHLSDRPDPRQFHDGSCADCRDRRRCPGQTVRRLQGHQLRVQARGCPVHCQHPLHPSLQRSPVLRGSLKSEMEAQGDSRHRA
jgi:hypothetical protein